MLHFKEYIRLVYEVTGVKTFNIFNAIIHIKLQSCTLNLEAGLRKKTDI